jgi:NAD(P)-dependent dehydrogenase (short-subunit alcohol dehydrogenase family)
MAGLVEGKVALVTGGGSGIGRATAQVFAREGATVAVADYVVEAGEETVRLITAAGGHAKFIPADVSQATHVEGMVRQVVETFGRLDCAHNNAGIEGTVVPLVEYAEEDWDRLIAVNLKGVFLGMKYEIAQMLKQGGGSGAIVNTASVAGLVGFPGLAGYVSSKFGVVGITKVAALEYAKAGIRVNAVCPGVIRTPMVQRLITEHPEMEAGLLGGEPIGRLGEPQEIGEAVVWLCSGRASFVTGQAFAVDGGWVAQ